MDQTGTTDFFWFEALEFFYYLLNHTIYQSLDAILEVTYITSAPLHFHWYQCVFCA